MILRSGVIPLLALCLLLAGCEAEPPQLTGNAETTLPAFTFNDLDGAQRSSDEWRDKVLLVNFWATWCPPCRKEMPLLIDFQEQLGHKGLQVVAIAMDDPSLVRDFTDVYGITFPVLIGNAEAMRLSNRMGNRFDSLPFTAIYDRNGAIRYLQAGELTRSTLERELNPLL
jgi:thiol-disulfide isomerase/thioredoxin